MLGDNLHRINSFIKNIHLFIDDDFDIPEHYKVDHCSSDGRWKKETAFVGGRGKEYLQINMSLMSCRLRSAGNIVKFTVYINKSYVHD